MLSLLEGKPYDGVLQWCLLAGRKVNAKRLRWSRQLASSRCHNHKHIIIIILKFESKCSHLILIIVE